MHHASHQLRFFLRSLCSAATFALCLGFSTAHATPIVDLQNAVTEDQATYLCGGSCNWQQSITAGRSGQLLGITLYGAAGTTGELRIGLGDGYVTGPWISDVQNAAMDGTTIDLRAYNIFLTAGQVFVADLLNATDSVFGSASAFGGPLLFSNADWGLEALAWDGALAYTTYFDDGNAAAMPLPPSWMLMGLGLAALLVIRGLKSRSVDANSCDCRAFDDAKMSS